MVAVVALVAGGARLVASHGERPAPARARLLASQVDRPAPARARLLASQVDRPAPARSPVVAAQRVATGSLTGAAAAPGRPRLADPLARWEGRGFKVATVRRGRSVVLRRSPGGGALKRVGWRTEFGSPRTFAVQARRGPWLGVTAAQRPNGRLAWVDGRSRALVASRTRWSLRADLSRRRVEVRHGTRVVRRFTVAVGRAGHPTPPGRFALTDKIDARRYGGTYGCCILALSGHQPALPEGWPGGDRLALHGTAAVASVGSAASTGCLRARDADLRPLTRRLPLGTPVFIRA